MPNETADAVERLSRAVVTTLWRQWAALGEAASKPPRTIVDLEALLLASEWFAEDEPRLTSASASWRRRFESLVSMQRLRNLAERSEKWLPSTPAAHRVSEPPAATASARKPLSRKQRSPVTPVARGIPTLQLQLRLLLGVGAKADTMALLLGRRQDASLPDWCIARETAYGSHAIRKVTKDLATANAIASSRDGQHRIVETDAWWKILQRTPPDRSVWQSWAVIFAWTAAARVIIRRGMARNVTPYALGGQLDALSEALGDPLPWSTPLLPPSPSAESGVAAFVRRCEELARELTNDA
ncbi:MAG: hypothetical protein U0163_19265 [Gemmatimonadaceae bacterium]